jgi:AcrR family transcriptional regulator
VERIVEAAHRLFLSRGFAETSMEAIAQEAGVSKATLYAHYGSRDELFTAVIWAAGDRFSSGLVSGVTGAADLRSKMERLAGAVLDLLLSPEVVATNRIVAAEARRFPELGKLFYENGPDRLMARLAEVFETAMAAGSLRRSAPRDVAKHFIGLIRGDLQLRAMLGDESAMSATERNRAITTGVAVFLAAYAPGEAFRES